MRRPSALLLAVAACAPPGHGDVAAGRPILEVHAAPGEPDLDGVPGAVIGVERLDGDGPFVAGEVERFRAVLHDDLGDADVSWSASDGALQPEGLEVAWTLPDHVTEAELEMTVTVDGQDVVRRFGVQLIAVSGAAAGPVDPGDDPTGSYCDLVIDGADVPHVLYRNDRHQQWWYARFTAGQWVRELVDGPGFQVGGRASLGKPTIALDRNGLVHVAFGHDDGTIWYGKRSAAGAWTVEQVVDGAAIYQGQHTGLLLDTNNNDAPLIFDTKNEDNGTYLRARIHRKPAASWLSALSTLPASSGSANTNYTFFRGAVLTGSNAVRFAFGYDGISLGSWSLANGFTSPVYLDDAPQYRVYPTPVLKAGAATGVLYGSGLAWNASGSGWDLNEVETFELFDTFDAVWDGTRPRLALVHNNNLELVRPDARGYWTYTIADTGVDTYNSVAVALDAAGTLHACYRKADRITFY